MSRLSPKKFIGESRNKRHADIIQSINALKSQITGLRALIVRQEELYKRLNEHLSEQISNSGILPISEHEILVKLNTGLKIYLDTRDISVAPHLALDGVWEPQTTNAWLSLVDPNDTILDIGANFGYFGLMAAYKTDKKKSKIVFFEANPHLIPYIKKTLATNFYVEQSIVENLAVAEKKGELTLNVLKDYIGSSTVHTMDHLDKYMHNKMYLKTQQRIKVKAISLDEYCEKNQIKEVDLIKMDIEGYEERAYMGMRKIIKASPRVTLFMEFTAESYDDPKGFFEQILDDFKYVYLIDKSGKLVKPKDNSYDSVIGQAEDWTMPVFSKRRNLAA